VWLLTPQANDEQEESQLNIEENRVFAIDMTTCPQCGGPLTILAAPSAGRH